MALRVEIDRTFDYYPDGSINAVHVRPVINAMNLRAMIAQDGLVADEIALLQALSEDLKRAVRNQLRITMGLIWRSDAWFDANVSGMLALHNQHNNAQEFHPNQPFLLRNCTAANFAVLFEIMQQSNRALSVYDVSWSFFINQATVRVGNSLTKIPKWVNGTIQNNLVFKPTWENHSDAHGHINCAAFAIAFHSATLNQRRLITTVVRLARQIMTDCGWDKDVSIHNILSAVKNHFPQKRISVITPNIYDHSHFTIAGPQYPGFTFSNDLRPSAETKKHTIYLAYLPVEKHYGLVNSPAAYYEHLGKSDRYWCGKCVNWTLRTKPCLCAAQPSFKKLQTKKKAVCPACNLHGCSGCIKKCKFCGVQFKKGYNPTEGEGHRCIVFQEPSYTEFWMPGDEQNTKDSKTMLWVYDLESAMKRVSGVYTKKFETNNGFIMDNGEVKYTNVEVSEHVVNLVVCRNVFDDLSERVYFGATALRDFVFDMTTINQGRNVIVAHNGSGYDSRLVFEAVTKSGVQFNMKMITTGTRFMTLKAGNAIFKDSLLFLPAALATLAKSFDLNMRKGIFPHLFNSEENYDYNGVIPSKEFFDMTFFAKTKKDIDNFDKWYDTRKLLPWNFKEELVQYCKDDVKILAQIVVKFHDICMNKFKSSPWNSCTGPGFAHKTILETLSKPLPIEENSRREVVQEMARETHWAVLRPIEYYFARAALRGGRTDVRRLKYTLSPEDIAAGRKIKYVDVVSMYPAVQVKCDYPVGLPTVIIYDKEHYPCRKHATPEWGNDSILCNCSYDTKKLFQDSLVTVIEEEYQPDLETLLHSKCFGFICVTITPPRTLFHPVLVCYDTDANKCVASLEPIKAKVFTTEEVKEAIKQGYTLQKVHRLDVYNRAPGLWSDFIKDLYIEKLANSGPLDEGELDTLVQQYEQKFGMGIAVRDAFPRFKYDGALRTVFKTLLNCGWGKHCQRPSLKKTEVKHCGDKNIDIFNNVQNGTIRIKRLHPLPGDYTLFESEINGELSPHNFHNTYLPAGVYVPAWGRLLLLEQMTKLGDRVLYHDTDSIIYIYEPDKYNVPENSVWGDWDEESISKEGITSFVSIAPKSYAVKTNQQELVKLKGLSIKHAHKDFVNFNLLEEFIDSHIQNIDKTCQIPQLNFVYKQGAGIRTTEAFKILDFKPENLKGVLHSNLRIYPFGYCESCVNKNCIEHYLLIFI